MGHSEGPKEFIPLNITVLTVSDTRTLGDDKSGNTLVERIEKAGHKLAARAIVTDDVEKIRAQVKAWIADEGDGIFWERGGNIVRGYFFKKFEDISLRRMTDLRRGM